MQNIASTYYHGIYSLSDPVDSHGNNEFVKQKKKKLEHCSNTLTLWKVILFITVRR